MVTSFHNGRLSPLPSYSTSSAVNEKVRRRHSPSRFVSLSLPIPGVKNRRLRLVFPNIRYLYSSSVLKYGRKLASLLFLLAFLILVFVAFALTKRFGTRAKKWPRIVDPSTLIFEREDLRRIWEWEVTSGHYPSRRPSMC
jgi:WD repeat and SOF domain-containing protein 1